VEQLRMARDWKNEEDYDYTEKHTPELWAWEFLRRNPDYIKDWNKALRTYQKNHKKQIPHIKAVLENKEKFDPIPGYSKAAYINDLSPKERNIVTKSLQASITNNRTPDDLHFDEARSKWGLFIPQIINPDIDKPSVEFPFSLFYTYRYYYEKDDFYDLPTLKSTEVFVVFDFAKPIQQQLEYYKSILEEDQHHLVAYSGLQVTKVSNKVISRKDQLRIYDAIKTVGFNYKEIVSVIFKNDVDYGNAQKKVRKSYLRAVYLANGGYRDILQLPSKMKKR